jgi:IS30 family transposase
MMSLLKQTNRTGELAMPYTHLTPFERGIVEFLYRAYCSIRFIARMLKRSPSTISRELKKNVNARGKYHAVKAQHRYIDERKKCVKQCKLDTNSELREYVTRNLEQEQWSPEQIAATVRRDYSWSDTMRICYETIYTFIYKDKRKGGDLFKHLRQARRTRRRRGNTKGKRGQIKDRISINLRPKGATNRSRNGHWEGDTIIGKNHKGGVVTLNERRLGFLLAAPIANRKVETVNRAIIECFLHIPKHLRRTLTLDNGLEFAGFKSIGKHLGIDIYFADPYSPWQRGSNENLNGLIRQYLPKGSDLTTLTQPHLNTITQKLNNRPRKRLHYQTPAKLMSVALGL